MVRHASLFSQLVGLLNRGQFYGLVFRHKAQCNAKGLSSRDHFVAMPFRQLAQAKYDYHNWSLSDLVAFITIELFYLQGFMGLDR